MPAIRQRTKSEGGVQAVALALQIIESLALKGRPLSVTELANELGTTKTRIFNHLRTLVEHGYAVQDPETERYRVGVRVCQIGGAAANEFDLVSVSRGPMRRIREEFGQTVVLSKFDGTTLYVVTQLEGTSALKISIAAGFVMGFHCTAQGKVALAFGPSALLEKTIANGLEALTESTITDPERLKEEVRAIRARGWATAPNETMARIDTLAVPIFNERGQFVATIAIVKVADEVDERSTKLEVQALKTAADEISRAVISAA